MNRKNRIIVEILAYLPECLLSLIGTVACILWLPGLMVGKWIDGASTAIYTTLGLYLALSCSLLIWFLTTMAGDFGDYLSKQKVLPLYQRAFGAPVLFQISAILTFTCLIFASWQPFIILFVFLVFLSTISALIGVRNAFGLLRVLLAYRHQQPEHQDHPKH